MLLYLNTITPRIDSRSTCKHYSLIRVRIQREIGDADQNYRLFLVGVNIHLPVYPRRHGGILRAYRLGANPPNPSPVIIEGSWIYTNHPTILLSEINVKKSSLLFFSSSLNLNWINKIEICISSNYQWFYVSCKHYDTWISNWFVTIVFSYISRITISGHSLSWNTLECRLSRTSLDRNANYPFVRASMTGDRASSDNMLNPNNTIDWTFSKDLIYY